MSRFDFLHPVLIDLEAKHKAEIDALQAKLEAAERESIDNNGWAMAYHAKAAKLAEALEIKRALAVYKEMK